MMKRSNAIHWFICGVLGMSTGVLLQWAISQSSIGYGTLSVIAAVACILNFTCGPDTQQKEENEGKK